MREQIVQEIRLPDGEVIFPLVANYKKANETVPLQPPADDGQPTGSSNVEPLLILATPTRTRHKMLPFTS